MPGIQGHPWASGLAAARRPCGRRTIKRASRNLLGSQRSKKPAAGPGGVQDHEPRRASGRLLAVAGRGGGAIVLAFFAALLTLRRQGA
jgi:hypothetical protein